MGDRRRAVQLRLPGPFDPFAYDGETITMKFFREKEWMTGPPGDLYRFEFEVGRQRPLLAIDGGHLGVPGELGGRSLRALVRHLFIHDAKGKDHPRRRWRFDRLDLKAPETLSAVERAISGPVGSWDYERDRVVRSNTVCSRGSRLPWRLVPQRPGNANRPRAS